MDFISMSEFSKDEILEILDKAKEIEKNSKGDELKGKIVASLFFEPSTRTRLSFTSASYRLGGKVLGFESPDMTSIQKGETLRDTIKMVECYSDIIVMRHYIEGSARFASEISKIPILNAGDGANEHPSQTLLDIYTIKKELGDTTRKKIAFVGDLKYGRTVHSLVKALSLFECEFYFIAPKIIQIPDYIVELLESKNLKYHILEDYHSVLEEIDIIYMTRIQRERFDNEEEYKKVEGIYKLSKKDIDGKVKDNLIILHPLPRVDEIDIDLDDSKYAKYFQQAQNGLYVREAMYLLSLEKERKIRSDIKIGGKCKNKKCVTQYEKIDTKYYEKNGKKYCYYCNKIID